MADVRILVPYSSQVADVDARRFRNDCGPTCAEMMGEWLHPEKNGVVGTDDIMQWITGGADKYTSFGDMQKAMEHFYGVETSYVRYAKADDAWASISQQIGRDGLPAIVLVHYGSLYFRSPSTRFTGPHFVLATGYWSEIWGTKIVEGLYYHDPLWDSYYGAFLRADKATWLKTWADCTIDGNLPFSCLIPKVG